MLIDEKMIRCWANLCQAICDQCLYDIRYWEKVKKKPLKTKLTMERIRRDAEDARRFMNTDFFDMCFDFALSVRKLSNRECFNYM